MMNAISIKGVSKEFKVNNSPALHFSNLVFKRDRKKGFLPLSDVSFDVKKGEKVAIIGRNGAGKSTLLRIIADIYHLDKGRVEVNGSLIFLDKLGNGLKGRLSLRENIYLVGGIFGLSKKEIQLLIDKILEFAGLTEYVDYRLFQLSSGMKSRITFSTTIHILEYLDPDIILLDEVLSGGGGDAEYKAKNGAKVDEFMKGNKTILLVTHNLKHLEKLCDKVIWLDKGRIKKQGSPKSVISAYELSFKKKKK